MHCKQTRSIFAPSWETLFLWDWTANKPVPLLQRGAIFFSLSQSCSLNSYHWEDSPQQKAAGLFCSRDMKKHKKPMENCLSTIFVPWIPAKWLRVKRTRDWVTRRSEKDPEKTRWFELTTKVQKLHLNPQHYITSAVLVLQALQRPTSEWEHLFSDIVTILGIGMRPLDFQTFFSATPHCPRIKGDFLHLLNGSNHQFQFLVLSLRILYEPPIGSTQNVCLITFQSIFLYNKLLRVWEIVSCQVMPLLVSARNVNVFLNEKKKWKWRFTFSRLHQKPRLVH